MKKFKILGVALMAVVAVSVFFACGSDDNGGDSSLVGSWVLENSEAGCTEVTTFNANGTGVLLSRCGSYSHTEDFKWRTSGNRLYMTFTYDDSYSGKEEETNVYIYSVSGDTMTVTDADSYSGKHTAVYKRQK